jgi:hypothetical protein
LFYFSNEKVVGAFYAYWSNYCTLRSYVWVEEHDTHDAFDRRVRRLMEQDNKKARDKAKKERNEEVRVSKKNSIQNGTVGVSHMIEDP